MTVPAKRDNMLRSTCYSSIGTICLDFMQLKRSLSDRIKRCSIYLFESSAYVHPEIELIKEQILNIYQRSNHYL